MSADRAHCDSANDGEHPHPMWLIPVGLGVLLVVVILLGGVLWFRTAQTGPRFKSPDLFVAAVHWPEEIDPLIAEGHDVNELRKGETPLGRAILFNQYRAARMLLERGADPNRYEQGVSVMTRRFADGRPPEKFEVLGHPYAPIASLTFYDTPEAALLVEKLLEHGADPNVLTVTGETPLQKAVRADDEILVERLLDAGADVNARSESNQTALQWAVNAQQPELRIIQLLLKAGAVPDKDQRPRIEKLGIDIPEAATDMDQ